MVPYPGPPLAPGFGGAVLLGGRLAVLGQLMLGHRQRRGLSQVELARLAVPALSVNTVANLERGRTRPSRRTLASLCDALELGALDRAELVAARRAANSAAWSADAPS